MTAAKAKPPKAEQDPQECALRLLARREHSRYELAGKLAARGFARDSVETVLDDLESEGWLSDSRFVSEFVRYRIRQGQGPLRITADLRHRGIDEAQARQALQAAEVDWQVQALDVYERRFAGEPPRDYRERARQMRFLQSRGFSAEIIRRVMNEVGKI
ncbi:regulatory protein RecX [Ectothiorhodospira marina]|uniref:Regulatory protein RecX n=1 Tax=Ectothiorhodospira marina TaxID=1396821 RepID=A0A1H7KUS9_9GAMM|nr:regulatory protein RecX [Ectothiorhodospira marina]SEK90559.1 regulatory protein [Ectothiorhodospira marina]